jgi:hypothetical protein
MRLAREPSDKTTREQLEILELQGHTLKWVHEYKYLGHRVVEAPEYSRQAEKIIPIDDKKLNGLCFAMARAFPSTARCCRVAPLAIRSGVKQVVHAKYLYPTALIDTDYKLLDTRIRRSLRYMLGLPTDSSSAQLHADLGIWPSDYYAHQRALRMAWRVANRYWTRGDKSMVEASDGSIVEGLSSERPKFLDLCRVTGGIVGRLGDILKEYSLTWEVVYQYQGGEDGWAKEISKRLGKRFADYCKEAASEYDHPTLAFAEPPRKDTPRIKRALRVGGELAVAALRMRCPSLRLRPDRDRLSRCRYCERGRENGRHLLQCLHVPTDLLEARTDILNSIKKQSGNHRISSLAVAADLALSLDWRLMDDIMLKRLLVWCRNMINRYADFVPQWETDQLPQLEAYPVHRIRPRCR